MSTKSSKLPVVSLRKMIADGKKNIKTQAAGLNRLKQRVEHWENELLLPAFKKRYEGKCFKYEQSYANGDVKWNAYVRILKVESITRFQYDWFAIIPELKTPKGVQTEPVKLRIHFAEWGDLPNAGQLTICSKKEFDFAMRTVMHKVQILVVSALQSQKTK